MRVNGMKRVEKVEKNSLMQAVFGSHKLYRLKPIRKKGASGFYEAKFYDRTIYIDDRLNIRTEPNREPLKWQKTALGDGYYTQSRIFIKEKKSKVHFSINAIRLGLWLFGDSNGNTVSLFNEISRKRCVAINVVPELNPKKNIITKSLKQNYIHL